MSVEININKAVKKYGNLTIIPGLDEHIKNGEFFTLLGPSGCGKTTLLRMIAGFNSIEGGTIAFNDKVINDIPAHERNIGMVFQSYAIFPHLTVRENVEYGLKLRKLPKAEMKEKVDRILDVVQITEYQDRLPERLSGGQQQRVALARAIVIHPSVLLMDEPLSNLDAKLRQKARTELVKLHEMFKPTMVYVTHDQIEAMTVAHRIAVMNQGRIQQIDTPYNIYHHPANTFVAGFIGSPAMNILEAQVLNNCLVIGQSAVKLPQSLCEQIADREKVYFGLRPEACTPAFGDAMIKGKVDFVENTGNLQTATLRLADGASLYVQDSHQDTHLEECTGVDFAWENVCLFDAETGVNLELGGK